MKNDITYIHVIRMIACMMVVCLHSLPSHSYNLEVIDSLFKTGITVATTPCVPLFFMITGALLLPIKTDPFVFWKKRISKVLYPLLIWGVIYSIIPYLLGEQSLYLTIKEILLCPIKNPTLIGGILWYLYILIGLYLIMPFIDANLYMNSKLQRIYLLIWGISSFAWLIQMYEPSILGINIWEHNMNALSYFWGYLGFCVLGVFFNVNKIKIEGMKMSLIYGGCSILIGLSILKIGGNLAEYSSSFLSIPSIIMTAVLFIYLKGCNIDTNGNLYKLIKNISSLSFGIYLSHMVIYSCITNSLYQISTAWIMQFIVMTLTFIGAWGLSFLLSKMPFSKLIIGI